MFTRMLGRSGIEVSAMGLGCWTIGGPWTMDGNTVGWGQVEDAESVRAIQAGLEHGITFFDTAACYGAGHSEQVLGRAMAGKRDQVVIATKFGHRVNEETRRCHRDQGAVLPSLAQDCENSLRRLNTSYIDLYQLHAGDYPPELAPDLMAALEDLVAQGKIRAYGWSTDHVERAGVFAPGEHCATIQHSLNVLRDAPQMLALCDQHDLGSINKNPLAMGFLAGKIDQETSFPADDLRSAWDLKSPDWVERKAQVEALRDVLTGRGRSLVQGAICWIWARSQRTVPIPGFRSEAQVKENSRALEFGPLSGEEMRQIDQIIGRT